MHLSVTAADKTSFRIIGWVSALRYAMCWKRHWNALSTEAAKPRVAKHLRGSISTEYQTLLIYKNFIITKMSVSSFKKRSHNTGIFYCANVQIWLKSDVGCPEKYWYFYPAEC